MNEPATGTAHREGPLTVRGPDRRRNAVGDGVSFFKIATLKGRHTHLRGVPMEERMLKLFAYGHLEREDLQAVSKPFAELAEKVVALVPAGPERTVSLRKLRWQSGCSSFSPTGTSSERTCWRSRSPLRSSPSGSWRWYPRARSAPSACASCSRPRDAAVRAVAIPEIPETE